MIRRLIFCIVTATAILLIKQWGWVLKEPAAAIQAYSSLYVPACICSQPLWGTAVFVTLWHPAARLSTLTPTHRVLVHKSCIDMHEAYYTVKYCAMFVQWYLTCRSIYHRPSAKLYLIGYKLGSIDNRKIFFIMDGELSCTFQSFTLRTSQLLFPSFCWLWSCDKMQGFRAATQLVQKLKKKVQKFETDIWEILCAEDCGIKGKACCNLGVSTHKVIRLR